MADASRSTDQQQFDALLEAETGGWNAAVRWLRKHADGHAGKWAGMEPREALKDAADKMEKARG